MQNKKDIFRQQSIKKLKNLKNKYILNKNINKNIQKTIDKLTNDNKNLKNILFFMPLSYEPNILSLIKKYRKKYNCFIPFIQNISFKMIPFRHPFVLSKFGTRESLYSIFYKKDLDIIIVPVIGYDSKKRRIGFGKGMYDRFVEKLQKKPIIIFVQLDNIYSKEIITQFFDIKYDIYITPRIIIESKI
jgi:5-formyltetrahydrofolate cyclo-ligase